MSTPKELWPQIIKAMRSAARKGFDPYNSHDTMSKVWVRQWRDRVRRER